MQHDSLTAGVLTRLDALTGKLGVGADALWSLWLATWWRPVLAVGLHAICLLAVLYALKVSFPRLLKGIEDDSASIGIPAMLVTIGGAFTILVLGVNLVSDAPDAIAYTLNHHLYAVDQLRGILGK